MIILQNWKPKVVKNQFPPSIHNRQSKIPMRQDQYIIQSGRSQWCTFTHQHDKVINIMYNAIRQHNKILLWSIWDKWYRYSRQKRSNTTQNHSYKISRAGGPFQHNKFPATKLIERANHFSINKFPSHFLFVFASIGLGKLKEATSVFISSRCSSSSSLFKSPLFFFGKLFN